MASPRLGAAVVVLAAAALLAGCSPPLYRQVAVHLVDGEVELLFAPCPGKRVHDVIVREVGPEAETGRIWHVSGGPDDATVASLRLFEVPDGWLTGADDLTELDADLSYRIQIEVDGVQESLVVGVTLSALAALDDDEVLGAGEANEGVAMTRAEFAEVAVEPCD